ANRRYIRKCRADRARLRQNRGHSSRSYSMLLMHGSAHSFVNIRCRVHLAVVKRIQTLLDLPIKLLLAQRSHVKWMPVGKFHLKRNTTLQNDLTQKQADSVG